MQIWTPLLTLLTTAHGQFNAEATERSSLFLNCVDNAYGLLCGKKCSCQAPEVCDDGPVGSGECYLPTPYTHSPRRKGKGCDGETNIFPFFEGDIPPHPSLISTVLGIDPLPTIAYNYSGHQFRDPSTVLGDGRSHNFEVEGTSYNAKGTGATVFTRPGTDGRATFSHSCREFLLTKFMNAVGIETVEAAYLHLLPCHSDRVVRDYLYEGEEYRVMKGGVLTRQLDPRTRSILRLGSVMSKDDFDEVCKIVHPNCDCRRECFFRSTVAANAKSSARWQALGFVHGSLNTDNVLLNGVTVDVSVSSFLKTFRLDFTPNLIDEEGIYSYGRAGEAMIWNLERLREVLGLADLDSETLFNGVFRAEFETLLEGRLGIRHRDEETSFLAPRPHILYGFLSWLERSRANINAAFHHLPDVFSGALTTEEYQVRVEVKTEGHGDVLRTWLRHVDGLGVKLETKKRTKALVWNDNKVANLCNIFDDGVGSLTSLVSEFNESFSAMLESFREGGVEAEGEEDWGGEEWEGSCSIQ
ncbi:hypothetical protein TrVE_jg7999 [Triparma verrucosa]|uniref:Selenoprotein O n=1 Tax=Triparma verrucosa TaxID=1606542 RepID=A0A9W7BLQ2_9STRA|nr:hypothetical protein TrVE_jg7999 [Triparma verrucosa]